MITSGIEAVTLDIMLISQSSILASKEKFYEQKRIQQYDWYTEYIFMGT
jgi:hypothetical protein